MATRTVTGPEEISISDGRIEIHDSKAQTGVIGRVSAFKNTSEKFRRGRISNLPMKERRRRLQAYFDRERPNLTEIPLECLRREYLYD